MFFMLIGFDEPKRVIFGLLVKKKEKECLGM